MQAGIGSFYPLMMLSGILWPIEGKILNNLNEKTYFSALTEKEKWSHMHYFSIL